MRRKRGRFGATIEDLSIRMLKLGGSRGGAPQPGTSLPRSARRAAAFALCAAVGFCLLPAGGAMAAEIESEAVTRIGVNSATVTAGFQTTESSATYVVQYGTGATYQYETEPAIVSRPATAVLTGLSPGTEYHFRFVVTERQGTSDGKGGGFATYASYPNEESHSLPDGRTIEMVSSPEAENAEVYPPGGEGLTNQYTYFPFQAAADGDAVAYVETATAGGNGSTGAAAAGDEHLAVRGPLGGWTQTNITPTGSDQDARYDAFSEELSSGVLFTQAEPPLAPTDSLREPNPGHVQGGLFLTRFGEPGYQPLFDGKAPYRKEHENAHTEQNGHTGHFLEAIGLFGTAQDGNGIPAYAGASSSLSEILFEANDQLLDGAGPPALEAELGGIVQEEEEGYLKEITRAEEFEEELRQPGISGKDREKAHREIAEAEFNVELLYNRDELYVSHEGIPSLVNVLPDGKVAPGARFGGQGTEAVRGAQADFMHDISADGSKIFWTEPGTSVEVHANVRSLELQPGPVYVRVNGTKTVAVSNGPAQFWTASTDGADAFYTEAGKLWRFEVESEKRLELAGAGGGVVGVIGTNETGPDGAYVYFVSTEALPGESQAKLKPVEGEDNLYVYEPDAETGGSRIAFVAALGSGEAGDWTPNMSGRVSGITPDGQAMTFMSSRDLTAGRYPNEGAEEVYVYDATEGSLICASCRPQTSGGHYPLSNGPALAVRHISEDGNEVFFDSSAPLVARDLSGLQNVYEWQRDGSGECEEATGCVYLLSSGIEGEAYVGDASVSGNDVFFVARQKLVPEDGTEDTVLYDARVNGVRPVAPPECTGTSCQGLPASPPVFATPASVTFEGVGNFTPATHTLETKKSNSQTCRRGRVRKHGKCVKQTRKRPKQGAHSSRREGGRSTTRRGR